MPEELCQVSPKSHYVALALHSDPSPLDKDELWKWSHKWNSQEMHCVGVKWSLRFLNDWNYGVILTLQLLLLRRGGFVQNQAFVACRTRLRNLFFAKYKRRSSFVGQRHTWRVMSYQHLRVYLMWSSHVLPRIIMLCRCFSYHSTMQLHEARVHKHMNVSDLRGFFLYYFINRWNTGFIVWITYSTYFDSQETLTYRRKPSSIHETKSNMDY